jgi:AcrR family transcriptional regulator
MAQTSEVQAMPQDDADRRKAIIDAALTLAAAQGWRELSLAQIAKAANLPLAEVYALFPSKQAILEGYLTRIDGAVLAGGEPDLAGETSHDRLFDVIMRRFETLAPHRAAVRAILHDSRHDPLAALCGMRGFLRSMSAMLEAAGIASDGFSGLLRAQGLGVVYVQTLRVWLSDDTPDSSRTMAALDRNLRRAEAWCGGLRRRPWRRGGEAPPEPPAASPEGQSAMG